MLITYNLHILTLCGKTGKQQIVDSLRQNYKNNKQK